MYNKYVYFLRFFLLLIFLLFDFRSNAFADIVDLIISKKQTKDVNTGLYGVSTANLFRYCNIDDISLKKSIDVIYPRVLRFPGGTIANFYHWDGNGYGFNHSDLALLLNGKIRDNVEKQFEWFKSQKITHRYVDDFIKFYKSSNRSEVLVVANIFSGTDKELLDLLDYLKNNDVDVVGVEFGNELYFREYRKVFPDVDSYVKRIQKSTLLIKQKYPNIKIGVVAAPSGHEKKIGYWQQRFFDQWNIDLAKNSFYDAVIVHLYYSAREFDEASGVENNIDNLSNDFRKYAFEGLMNTISYYSNIYGDRRIWITEWNMMQPKQASNTLLHAFYTIDFLLNLVVNASNRGVEYASYHNLCEPWRNFSLFSPSESVAGLYDINASFYAFELTRNIFKSDVDVVNSSVQLRTPNKGSIPLDTFAFFDKSLNQFYVFVLNRSEINYNIGNLYVNEKPVKESVEFSFYRSSKLSSGPETPFINDKGHSQVTNILVKPYSIGYFAIKD